MCLFYTEFRIHKINNSANLQWPLKISVYYKNIYIRGCIILHILYAAQCEALYKHLFFKLSTVDISTVTQCFKATNKRVKAELLLFIGK